MIKKVLANTDYVDESISTVVSEVTSGFIVAAEATHATKAISDANDNVIVDTYETKVDANAKLIEAKSYADSSAKIVKDDLLNGAGTAYDTLKELGDLINENVDAIDALETIAVGKADADHNHDSVYYTQAQIDTALSTKQPAGNYLTAIPDEYVTETELSSKGFLTSYTETDPTVPSWAKASSKPTYTKSEIGLGNVDNVKQYSADNPPPYPVTSVNGQTGAVTIIAVPSSTMDNNGQFLRVVNGAAAWATVPNAEEASF